MGFLSHHQRHKMAARWTSPQWDATADFICRNCKTALLYNFRNKFCWVAHGTGKYILQQREKQCESVFFGKEIFFPHAFHVLTLLAYRAILSVWRNIHAFLPLCPLWLTGELASFSQQQRMCCHFHSLYILLVLSVFSKTQPTVTKVFLLFFLKNPSSAAEYALSLTHTHLCYIIS